MCGYLINACVEQDKQHLRGDVKLRSRCATTTLIQEEHHRTYSIRLMSIVQVSFTETISSS